MTESETNKNAVPVRIEHSGRSVDALEWSTSGSAGTIVVAVERDVADLVGPVAEQLMNANRVIGLEAASAWDPVTVSWWAPEPVVLVAQGGAGKLACDTARLAPGALRALVLADVRPGTADFSGINSAVLVFHGRESASETHAEAVLAHDQIPGSHLIELDNCAELPTRNCPTILAESLTWYLDTLGEPFIEFHDFAGSDAEPVDPRA